MDFETFWRAYPRRVAKGAAQRSWDKLAKLGTAPNDIIKGAEAYASACRGKEVQYIAHPATWLNAQRWLDDASQPDDEPTHKPAPERVKARGDSLLTLDFRDELIDRTRQHYAAKLSEAARRLNCKPGELWDCMLHGFDGIQSRAYDVAKAHIIKGAEPIAVLPIERNHWLSGKDRLETRARIVKRPVFSAGQVEGIVSTSNPSTTEEPYDDDTRREVT